MQQHGTNQGFGGVIIDRCRETAINNASRPFVLRDDRHPPRYHGDHRKLGKRLAYADEVLSRADVNLYALHSGEDRHDGDGVSVGNVWKRRKRLLDLLHERKQVGVGTRRDLNRG